MGRSEVVAAASPPPGASRAAEAELAHGAADPGVRPSASGDTSLSGAAVPARRGPPLFAATPFRIVAATLGALVAMAAVIFGLLFWQTNALLSEQVVAGLSAEAGAIVAEGHSGGLPALVDAVNARAHGKGPGFVLLTDIRGGRLAGNLPGLPPELTSEAGAAMPGGGLFRLPSSSGEPAHLAFGLVVDTAAGARLLVARDVDAQRQYARRMQRAFLVGFGLLALAGLAGGLMISRRVLGRIDAIADTSRRVMAGDMSRRVPLAGSGDEIDDLAGNLNAMLDRIETLMAGLREVSDNIAHDLKTPLTRLRTRAEAALRDGRETRDYRDALERTIEEADDLIKTFNALLLIARLEAGALEQSKADVDLATIVQDAVELYEPLAEERGVALRVTAVDGLRLGGNRQLIGQAVANMIDNAIKYSASPGGAAGPIAVTLAQVPGGAEIAVADRGPGIPAVDRERALKRFVRLDQSRSQPGTGLGLSLVAAVARLHGGTVRLEDNAPGLRIVLALPRRDDGERTAAG